MKRMIAFFLSFALAFSMLPVSAVAAEMPDEETVAVETEAVETAAVTEAAAEPTVAETIPAETVVAETAEVVETTIGQEEPDAYYGTYGDFEYSILGADRCSIERYNGTATVITVPAVIEGCTVVSIGRWAFSHCSSLTSVTFPGSITTFALGAFNDCTSLTSITLPDSLTYIGEEAFQGCSALTSITLPDSLTYIGEAAFRGCSSLTGSITIPEGVTTIGDAAFVGCSSLTSITLPESVTAIGGYAFSGCSSLTSITLPESVTTIGDGTFAGCSSLTSITIPEGVTSIGYGAFEDCSALASITIPESVTSIGNHAFYKCSSLTGSITIPEGVTTIEGCVFYDCSSLTSITIPESVTSIGNHAFYKCSSLTGSITIPEGVTTIGEYAFYDCSSLTSITIPESVTTIGRYAFYGCSSLTGSITIPEGVTTIEDSVFKGCSSLTGITIPESVTKIGWCAFEDCSSLTGNITIPEGVTTIEYYVFYDCSSLTSITLPESVTTIEKCAFSDCYSLTSITLPEGLSSIGEMAFRNCARLEEVYIPASVESIGKHAFSSESLTWIPKGVGCKGFRVSKDNPCYSNDNRGVLFNKDQTVLIQAPTLLTGSYEIPKTVHTIESRAFSYCKSLTGVTIPATVTTIPEYAFEECALKEINLPEGVAEIEGFAFGWQDGRTRFDTLTIPVSMKKLASTAFVGNNFTDVYFYGDPPAVEIVDEWNKPYPIPWASACYYDAENVKWTDEAKIALAGEDSLSRWKPLGPVISVDIPAYQVYTYPMICGTVMAEGSGTMTPSLTLDPSEPFTQVSVKLTLPEGFSFAQNQIVKEWYLSFVELSQTTFQQLPPIYPIYIDEANQAEEYAVTVTTTAMDSTGEWRTRTEKEVFYRPSATRNTAQSLCPNFTAEDYTFTLGSATGNGTTYNHETARLCAMMSDMAYDRDNMETFLTAGLGFSGFERQGIFVDSDPKWNVSGRYYASKRIIEDGKIKNLVYVICRGTANKSLREWISNAMTGGEDTHHGFDVAASAVKKELKDYCKKHEFEAQDTIIVVTGHSRGAAVSNLVGQWLNTSAGLAQKENVSVYTFATPTVNRTIVNEQAGLAGNENIFNFVNYQDVIRNSPSMKFYGRYGHTTIFAFDVSDAGATTHNDGYGSYDLPDDGSNFTLLELVNGIMYSNDPAEASQTGNIVHGLAQMGRVASRIYGPNTSWLAEEGIAHSMKLYYQAVVKGAAKASVDDVNARTRAAYDYYLSIRETLEQKIQTIIHQFNCPVNIRVYDANGTEVAAITDEQITCGDDNLIVYMQGNAKVVACPEDVMGNYTIRIEGYDDGTMIHSILAVSDDGIEDLEQRTNIPIANGGTLELNAEGYVELEGETNPVQAYNRYEDKNEIKEILTGLMQEAPGQEEPDINVTRLYGDIRYRTAIQIADELKATWGVEKFDTIVVASGEDFPDALAGTYLASVVKAPIVLNRAKGGYSFVATYIQENLAKNGKIYMLGGTAALDEQVETNLKKITPNVVRLAGNDRYATCLEILKEAAKYETPSEVMICSGVSYADTLVASATTNPVLLVYGGASMLNQNQKAYLTGKSHTIVGDEATVGTKIATALGKASTANGRIAGDSCVTTSIAVAESYFKTPTTAVLASGKDYPDGLCGGVLAIAKQAPLLLVADQDAAIADYIANNNIQTGIVVGGKAVVSRDSVTTIFGVVEPEEGN